jgi:predicted nucleotidyltransferase component of viral defense system
VILKREIDNKAKEHLVSRSTIDKDWVLGHFIDAIFSIQRCRSSIVFKGGTCLRKCYIADYRFSEDLDFTITSSDFILDKALLTEITTLVTQRTESPLYIEQLTQLRHKDIPTGYTAIVKFWGADHSKDQAVPPPQRWTTSIKIEMIQYEKMLFPVIERPVTHDYSDKLTNATNAVACYNLQEVMAEKLRALIQRSYTAPRDYYDIWYLSRNIPDWDWPVIVNAFHEKMKFKNLEFTGMEQLINDENDRKIKAAWTNSLGHQINPETLSSYELVKKDLTELFNKIF